MVVLMLVNSRPQIIQFLVYNPAFLIIVLHLHKRWPSNAVLLSADAEAILILFGLFGRSLENGGVDVDVEVAD